MNDGSFFIDIFIFAFLIVSHRESLFPKAIFIVIPFGSIGLYVAFIFFKNGIAVSF